LSPLPLIFLVRLRPPPSGHYCLLLEICPEGVIVFSHEHGWGIVGLCDASGNISHRPILRAFFGYPRAGDIHWRTGYLKPAAAMAGCHSCPTYCARRAISVSGCQTRFPRVSRCR
jgi:hypothetical protein